MSKEQDMLELINQVLIRCTIMGIVVLLIWWGALVLIGDLAYSVHSWIVPLTREQFNLIHYGGMLLTKMVIFLFFLFPYISIRMVLLRR